MKHKTIGLISIFIFLISLMSCNTDATVLLDSSLQAIPANSKSVFKRLCYINDASNFKELSKEADYIVLGTLQDDAKQKLYYADSKSKDQALYGVTVSTFNISEVFKGNLKEGNTIKIAETYFTQENNGDMIQYLMDYGPSEPNREYVFFLNKEDDKNEFLEGYFSPSIREKGRYPVLNKPLFEEVTSQDIQDLTLVSVTENEYLSLLKEVRAFLNVH